MNSLDTRTFLSLLERIATALEKLTGEDCEKENPSRDIGFGRPS